MQNRECVIKIEDLYKRYRLGAIGGGTLTADLQSWWARVRKKEDPNRLIGEETQAAAKTFMALNGLSLEVYKGDTLGIIGGNGAGKSTMLKILSRVTAPTQGTISIKGRISSMLEVGTGFHGELSGRENIYLNGAILGMSKGEVDQKIEDIIEFSECRRFIDTPVKRYSSGMYVKLAFSVSAHLDSEILVMDEVLAVGDMKFQEKCLGKMGDVADKEGRTVLYVSHNMNTIRQLCNRCIVLGKGEVIYDGNVDHAIETYMDSAGDLSARQDLTTLKHSINDSHKVDMLMLSILNKNEAVLDYSDEVVLELASKGNADIRDVRFRIEISFADKTRVGVAFTDRGIDFEKNQIKHVKFQMDIGNLAPGKYQFALLAYQSNELGSYTVLDRVFTAMTFQVSEVYNKHKLVWSHSSWGHVKLPDLKVIEVQNG